MIGLCGAHRVGKTTLAKMFAQAQGFPFVETSTSAVFAQLGLDPTADYPLADRLAIQYFILNHLREQWAEAAAKSPVWVADRTPVDLAAYLLADVSRNSCSDILSREVENYVAECIKLANRFFGVLVLVQPGIEPVVAEGKALPIPAYQEHLNHLMFGILMDDRLLQRHFFIKRSQTGLEERIGSLTNAVGVAFKQEIQNKATVEVPATIH